MVTFQVLFYIHSGNPTYVSIAAKRFQKRRQFTKGNLNSPEKNAKNSLQQRFTPVPLFALGMADGLFEARGRR
jgi:hypothetical protein